MIRTALAAASLFAFASPALAAEPMVEITRLDCGAGVFQDFNGRFSDTHEYADGPRIITNSCYLVRHMGHYLLWDSGFAASMKGAPAIKGPFSPSLRVTVAEQLATLGVKPSDVNVVGISHMHADQTGQAATFPAAKLIVGKADFEQTKGPKDPFGPWRSEGGMVQTMHGGDIDIFGDGTVIALNMPGHTPDHMSLLVKLASGNVLLTGDLYHATEARELKGVPPFNASRAETLASMDRFERLAKRYNAKVIIQHEPRDIAKLPAFPASAK